MNLIKNSIFIAVFTYILLLSSTLSADEITPSHVYQVSEQIVREIQLLREAVGADDYPLDPDRQTLKRPIQVYGKAVELMYKVSSAQTKFGLTAAKLRTIPPVSIQPKEVYSINQEILSEIRKIKTYLAIPTSIEEVPFVDGKVPSNVYENLWRASYMMDFLSGVLLPSDVYHYAEQIIDEIELVAKKNNINLNNLPKATKKENIRPKNVAAKGVQNLQKLIRIEKKMGYNASIVPTMTLSRVTPSDVFDIMGALMAELAYIKFNMGITETPPLPPKFEGKKPADVLQRLDYAGFLLDRVLAGVRRK